MQLLAISEIRRATQNSPSTTARTHVQVEASVPKVTREQQPYCEMILADACDRMTLRVWSDHPDYRACSEIAVEQFLELQGEFFRGQYGLEVRKWTVRPLVEQEISDLLQGPPELRAKQTADWELIISTCEAITDPRLRVLCTTFIDEWGERFRRTAAARSYHHARRGGLVEHCAQMMRLALAIAPLYPQLNADLLIAGILFHDSGKLWENSYSDAGFVMAYDELGELMGHISIGLELVNSLWRKISSDNAAMWKDLKPSSEDVRMHLLHLIAAHHGEKELGSPVDPKTPEAQTLHYIDNLDAKLEMFFAGYAVAKPLAPRIFDRVRPLPANLVKSLEKFEQPESERPKNGELL